MWRWTPHQDFNASVIQTTTIYADYLHCGCTIRLTAWSCIICYLHKPCNCCWYAQLFNWADARPILSWWTTHRSNLKHITLCSHFKVIVRLLWYTHTPHEVNVKYINYMLPMCNWCSPYETPLGSWCVGKLSGVYNPPFRIMRLSFIQ